MAQNYDGKGMVVAALADQYDAHVRVGGCNAGHTFWHDDKKFVGRSVPVGWINPEANLFIGPGAVLDRDVLLEEIGAIEEAGYSIRPQLTVDARAVLISRAQHMGEGGIAGAAHRTIGSTGEGVGLARMSRINRDAIIPIDRSPYACIRVQDNLEWFEQHDIIVGDVAADLHRHLRAGSHILLEGTQGYGLSMTLGPWPFCTSADTNAAQLASDAGISPTDVSHTILVARTFPIRVAGNSGPLHGETTWEELGFEPEITTVTKKVRRVGTWDYQQVKDACETNFPANVVVTFLDYLWPDVKDIVNWRALPAEALEWISAQEDLIQAPIIAVGTGPKSYCPLKPCTGALGISAYLEPVA